MSQGRFTLRKYLACPGESVGWERRRVERWKTIVNAAYFVFGRPGRKCCPHCHFLCLAACTLKGFQCHTVAIWQQQQGKGEGEGELAAGSLKWAGGQSRTETQYLTELGLGSRHSRRSITLTHERGHQVSGATTKTSQ